MRKIVISFSMLAWFSVSGQIGAWDKPAEQPIINTVQPLPFNELLQAGLARQKMYDDNQQYADWLLDKIYEIKRGNTDDSLNWAMDNYIKQLKEYFHADYSRLSQPLRDINLGIKEELYNYHEREIRPVHNDRYKTVTMDCGIYVYNQNEWKLLKVIDKGIKVLIINEIQDLYIVKYNGLEGYMKKDCLN